MQNARKAALRPEFGVHVDVGLQIKAANERRHSLIVGEKFRRQLKENWGMGRCGTWLLTKQPPMLSDLCWSEIGS